MNTSRATQTRLVPYCPRQPDTGLDEGPVQYRCPRGPRVQAADLNREVTR